MSDPENNFASWRDMVGVDDAFPALAPIEKGRFRELMVFDPEQIEKIYFSIGRHRLSQISVEPGWGGQTLFRYLLAEAQNAITSELTLPIDLSQLFLVDRITLPVLETTIQYQILFLLADKEWERVGAIDEGYYYDCIAYDSGAGVARDIHRAALRQFFINHPLPKKESQYKTTQQALKQKFPWLKNQESMCDLIGYLFERLQIKTHFHFHFPRATSEQQIRDTARAVKILYESKRLGKVTDKALREVHVCTPGQAMEFQRDFQRPYNPIVYPRYSPGQIYSMLLRRYRPERSKASGLDTVFSERFISGLWEGAGSISSLLADVRQAILRRLDCPKEEVPFFLEPLATAPLPPRRRPFTRTRKS